MLDNPLLQEKPLSDLACFVHSALEAFTVKQGFMCLKANRRVPKKMIPHLQI